MSTVNLASQCDDSAGGKLMGEARRSRGQVNWGGADFSGLTGVFVGSCGVYEDDGLCMAEDFREFGRELMSAEDFDICVRKLSFQFIGGAPREAIVGPHWISVGDDEDAGHSVELDFVLRACPVPGGTPFCSRSASGHYLAGLSHDVASRLEQRLQPTSTDS